MEEKKNPIHHGEEQHVAGERELPDRISKTAEQPMQRSFEEPSQPTQRSVKEPPQGRSNDARNMNGAGNKKKKTRSVGEERRTVGERERSRAILAGEDGSHRTIEEHERDLTVTNLIDLKSRSRSRAWKWRTMLEEKQDMNQIDEQEPSQQNRLCKKAME